MTLLVIVISRFLLLPCELKNRDTKRRILNILKIAHEKFTWSGREIPYAGRYGGHKWQRILAQGVGCTRSIPSPYRVFGLSRISSKYITSTWFNE